MDPIKSLDKYKLIAALLRDVHLSHGTVFNCRSLRLTLMKVRRRLHSEGDRYLTVALPRLGKAFDKAISGNQPLASLDPWFKCQVQSKLPLFMGEFFKRVLSSDGVILPDPCVDSVRVIRQVCYLFYKYRLPYTDEQCQQVVDKFKRTETQLIQSDQVLASYQTCLDEFGLLLPGELGLSPKHRGNVEVARGARKLLEKLFSTFDPKDIRPRHGPGAVATKQQLWEKYQWKNISAKITEQYPLDEYFYASLGHVCDAYKCFGALTDRDLPARVILVPKDSRGPRLISCEPVDYQWVQQGLGAAIVKLVESHPLTRGAVNFTSQRFNRGMAYLGSFTGEYATLDLNEASDRVSVELVRLLFPERLLPFLFACRSSSTVLPSGECLKLQKFAPMGSCLCFPIMALTIWAILRAAAPDTDTKTSILVYGDDVIVPTAYAVNAMEQLESFGLKINQDKSCTKGLFRESCGAEAFNGYDVTPVRLRTVWSSSRSADVYCSWIAYANQFYDKRYFTVYDEIVERLHRVYGTIPDESMYLTCPSLRVVDDDKRPKRRRNNLKLQKLEYYVYDIKSPSISKTMDGWSMLLRFFAETGATDPLPWVEELWTSRVLEPVLSFSVSKYTRRRTSMLVRRWR